MSKGRSAISESFKIKLRQTSPMQRKKKTWYWCLFTKRKVIIKKANVEKENVISRLLWFCTFLCCNLRIQGLNLAVVQSHFLCSKDNITKITQNPLISLKDLISMTACFFPKWRWYKSRHFHLNSRVGNCSKNNKLALNQIASLKKNKSFSRCFFSPSPLDAFTYPSTLKASI